MTAETTPADRPRAQRQPALVLDGLSKTFGGIHALRNVSLTVERGEIHGLVGENGSGKSTLIKVLAGFHAPDSHTTVQIGGRSVELPLRAGEAQGLGLRFVHQELGLIPRVSVLENLLIEDFATTNVWRLSWKAQRRRAGAMCDELGLSLPLDVPVERLRPTERALLAIARAIAHIRQLPPAEDGSVGGLLVLDEPTVYLPEREREVLFDAMRQVSRQSVGIIFVSHDVDEVLAVTDRTTVLRDGTVVGTVVSRESSPDDLVEMILGRRLAPHRSTRDEAGAEVDLARVRGLVGGGSRGVSFRVGRGEVLGLTGLPGAGFDDVPYLLFGALPCKAGVLELEGRTHDLSAMNPIVALRYGLALIPADRGGAGAVGSLPVLDNVSLPVLDNFQRGPHLSRRRVYQAGARLAGEFDVRPRDPRLPYSSLSGGNQQKVLLAKWLQVEPTLLLLHEPTQGVDVGAREEVFSLLRRATARGSAVLCASSDHEQLAAICDRVLVIRGGRVVRELAGSGLGQHAITDACYSSSVDAAADDAALDGAEGVTT